MKNKHTIVAIIISLILVAIIAYQVVTLFANKRSNTSIESINQPKELDIIFGSPSAPFSLYMYSSYSCVHCQRFFQEVLPQLEQEYINSGQLNLVVRMVDFSDIPQVNDAYRIAVCIHRYGYYAHLHELLLANFRVVTTNDFSEMIDEFTQADDLVAQCFFGGEAQEYLDSIKNEFERLNFKGTPTFVVNKVAYTGYMSFKKLSGIISEQFTLNEP